MQATNRINPSLAETIDEAFKKDYFVVMLISSRTRGMFESKNLPYGVGKTTLALDLSYTLHGNEIGDENWENAKSDAWDEVFSHLGYFPSDVATHLMPNELHDSIKIPCEVWDDTQKTAPASTSVPEPLRQFAGSITTNRPECRTLIMTAPNMEIAAPFRKLVVFELIVFDRGKYEVQQIKYRKNFKDPFRDKINSEYIEGTRDFSFPELPPSVQARYNNWRKEQKLRDAKYMINSLKKYEKTRYQEQLEITPEAVREASRVMGLYSEVKRRQKSTV